MVSFVFLHIICMKSTIFHTVATRQWVHLFLDADPRKAKLLDPSPKPDPRKAKLLDSSLDPAPAGGSGMEGPAALYLLLLLSD
jgi:hypothetical protein